MRNLTKSLRSSRTFSSQFSDIFCHATSESTSLMVSIFSCTCGSVAFSCSFSAIFCTERTAFMALVSPSSISDNSMASTSTSNFFAPSSNVLRGSKGEMTVVKVVTSTSDRYVHDCSSLKWLTSAQFSLTEMWLSDSRATCSRMTLFISSCRPLANASSWYCWCCRWKAIFALSENIFSVSDWTVVPLLPSGFWSKYSKLRHQSKI